MSQYPKGCTSTLVVGTEACLAHAPICHHSCLCGGKIASYFKRIPISRVALKLMFAWKSLALRVHHASSESLTLL